MSKTRVKLFLWAMIMMVAAIGLRLLIARLADLVAYFQQGADPASALNIVPNVPPDLKVRLTWLPDAADTGRSMEPLTRTQIESAYLRAWLQWNISYLRHEPYGLNTYFVGPALAAVTESIQKTAARGWQAAQIDTAHTLRLNLYSADGSIVSLTDSDARITQRIRDAAGASIFTGDLKASYDVVMLLEDGNWRVRHWVRTAAAPIGAFAPLGEAEPRPGFAGRDGSDLVLDGQRYHVAGVNYYPQATPWDAFWANYDAEVVAADLATVRALGLNTVRVFVPFEPFGAAEVKPEFLERLSDLLDQADAQHVKVIVTLFDFRTDYSLVLWPQADRHLETLLTRFANHPAILAWDLKNEPDRDYASAEQDLVDAWLLHCAGLAREYDPHHLLTIGWFSPEAAQAFPEALDIISFHYYAPVSELPNRYLALRRAVPERPILVGEFGLPTWNSAFFPHGHTEAGQARYYADLLTVLRTTENAGYLAWTLYDFDQVPANVAGRFPWQTGPQKHMGVVRSDGQPKPAALLLAPGVSLSVTRVPGWARFLKPFWLTVTATATAFSIALVFGLHRRLRSRTSKHGE